MGQIIHGGPSFVRLHEVLHCYPWSTFAITCVYTRFTISCVMYITCIMFHVHEY